MEYAVKVTDRLLTLRENVEQENLATKFQFNNVNVKFEFYKKWQEITSAACAIGVCSSVVAIGRPHASRFAVLGGLFGAASFTFLDLGANTLDERQHFHSRHIKLTTISTDLDAAWNECVNISQSHRFSQDHICSLRRAEAMLIVMEPSFNEIKNQLPQCNKEYEELAKDLLKPYRASMLAKTSWMLHKI